MEKWKIVETDAATGAEVFQEMETFDAAVTSALGKLNTPSDHFVRIEGPDGEDTSAGGSSDDIFRSTRWRLKAESYIGARRMAIAGHLSASLNPAGSS